MPETPEDTIRPAHPAALLADLTIGQAWWSLSVPPLKALRMIGLGRPKLPKADLDGKVAIVTGCNRGVGARTALHLAEMGATVVLACRRGQGSNAKTGIMQELQGRGVSVDGDKLQPMELDLLSMKSIRDFANAFMRKHKRLDILVNNAGVSEPGLTPEGYSITFTTNFIGQVELVDCLYPTIKNTEGARVVNVASVFHQYGDNTKWQEAATGRRGETGAFDVLTHSYADSKLAMLMFALDLRRRFAADGVSATAFAVHPGNCRTDLWRYVPHPLHAAFDGYMRVCFLSPEHGCYTSLAAAVEPLDRLRESDGTLARFIQPYWCPITPVRERAGHQIGPFVGWQIGVVSLPDNLEEALDRLRQVSRELVEDLAKKQETHAKPDPAASKGVHPAAAEEYANLAPRDVPIRF